jgi:hypothetical protein
MSEKAIFSHSIDATDFQPFGNEFAMGFQLHTFPSFRYGLLRSPMLTGWSSGFGFHSCGGTEFPQVDVMWAKSSTLSDFATSSSVLGCRGHAETFQGIEMPHGELLPMPLSIYGFLRIDSKTGDTTTDSPGTRADDNKEGISRPIRRPTNEHK